MKAIKKVSPRRQAASPPPTPQKARSQIVVGVGASAGGLEAFTQLLRHLPTDTGMAFVLVQHFDPQHESILTHLLAQATSMPVQEVTHNLRVKPDRVYVIPPNVGMTITHGALKLTPRVPAAGAHHPIDAFFESLAQDKHDRAIGVILSGNATDGTLGLGTIKGEGGITFAQDSSARYDSMPRSAIAAGCVDFVLPPRTIAKELGLIARHPYVAGAHTVPVPEKTPKASRQGTDAASNRDRENGLKQIFLLLRNRYSADFSLYKSATIERRINRRVVLNKQKTLSQYAAYLKGNVAELTTLYSDLLISVTTFFRNPEAFEALKRHVFPRILRQRQRDDPFRVWVVACSTGQEAYSIAMSFAEFSDNTPNVPKLQIFATDLSDAYLEKARQGLYPKTVAQDVSPERLQRFFVEENGGYRISKSLREQIVFARHNLLNDPPFSRMDLISCRNLLIYLQPTLQNKVIPALHYALKPGGSLFLGGSESIGQFTEIFDPEDSKQKIFVKKAAASQVLYLPLLKDQAAPAPSREETLRIASLETDISETRDYLEAFQDQHDANEELQAANEEVQSANEELQSINEELETSKEELESTNEELITVNEELGNSNVELSTLNADLNNLHAGINTAIVLFGPNLAVRRFTPQAEKLFNLVTTDIGRLLSSVRHNLNVPDLEALVREVIDTVAVRDCSTQDKEGRWYAIRVHPYMTHDAKIDGALLVAVDIDALKKSELENQAARDYAEAIIRTARNPLLVLRADLRVNTASEAFYKVFNGTPEQTKGRSIFEITNGAWDIPKLRALLEDILPRNSFFNEFEVVQDFPGLGLRTMLLTARPLDSGAGSGMILLVIDDVTERKQIEVERADLLSREQAARVEAETANRAKDEFLATVSHELRSPLTAMLGWARLLRYGRLDEAMTARALETIERCSTSQARLIEDLLEVSRIITGKLHLEFCPVDLRKVVEAAVDVVRPAVDARKIRLEVAVDPAIGMIAGDPDRLQQVLWNLLSNAAKFTSQGGRIAIRLEQTEGSVHITVTDTGEGISPEFLPHVFDRFRQADSSTRRSYGGLGLGLAIVRHLVEAHGGTVSADSQGDGLGASFVIILPIRAVMPQASQPDPLQVIRQTGSVFVPASALAGVRVLVVDDQPDARDLLTTTLAQYSAETETRSSATAAMEALEQWRPDVLLINIGMPGEDGYHLIRRVRASKTGDWARIPAIAVTAYARPEDRVRAISEGYQMHVTKPVEPTLLVATVARLVRRGAVLQEALDPLMAKSTEG